jgi:ribosomal protein L20
LNQAKITLNRKVLSELAVHDPEAFKQIAAAAKVHIDSRKNSKTAVKEKAAV